MFRKKEYDPKRSKKGYEFSVDVFGALSFFWLFIVVLAVALALRSDLLSDIPKNFAPGKPIPMGYVGVVFFVALIVGWVSIFSIVRVTQSFTIEKILEDVKDRLRGSTVSLEAAGAALETREREFAAHLESASLICDTLTRLQGGLTPLLDKVEDSNWYLSWEQFHLKEQQIRNSTSKVHAYIVTNTLAFDTDNALLPSVKENVAAGAHYTYILPDRGLEGRLNNILSVGNGAVPAPGKVKGIISHCRTTLPLGWGELALFVYEDANECNHYEGFMAITDPPKPHATPWLALGQSRSEALLETVLMIVRDLNPAVGKKVR